MIEQVIILCLYSLKRKYGYNQQILAFLYSFIIYFSVLPFVYIMYLQFNTAPNTDMIVKKRNNFCGFP